MSSRDIYTCYYCGYHDDKVEAGGLYHCPNKFCQGPGNYWQRTVNGYQDKEGNQDEEQFYNMLFDLEEEMVRNPHQHHLERSWTRMKERERGQ